MTTKSDSSEEQLDLNQQAYDQEFGEEVGKRLRANRCPRCDGQLTRTTNHESDTRYCQACRMTIISHV
jgi:uncharacterized protein with PIN domain